MQVFQKKYLEHDIVEREGRVAVDHDRQHVVALMHADHSPENDHSDWHEPLHSPRIDDDNHVSSAGVTLVESSNSGTETSPSDSNGCINGTSSHKRRSSQSSHTRSTSPTPSSPPQSDHITPKRHSSKGFHAIPRESPDDMHPSHCGVDIDDHHDRSFPLPARGVTLPDLHCNRLRVEMSCFMLGLYGLCTVAFSGPLLALWNSGNVESFELPPHSKLSMLGINTVLDSTYNALLLFGILTTSPLFMSVGTMMVMPFSLLTDRILHGVQMGPAGILGAIVIVIGFTMLNIPQTAAARWYGKFKRRCCDRSSVQ